MVDTRGSIYKELTFDAERYTVKIETNCHRAASFYPAKMAVGPQHRDKGVPYYTFILWRRRVAAVGDSVVRIYARK